ncbi:AAA family ATPase [Candidatus Venteria ishoeyi]|uniref:DUF3696 domain-containing protein n=1 Tax=Candidatus Venteria ishoeyi TaxID=1899563 RepID=A0A1H6FJ56_9GAMM|nr:DUF3696 domain-containing protein [Candidatus Venteria ishoeyi]SEH09075.1 Uncharacterised protein [Candidatus Venteria ishoeyi]
MIKTIHLENFKCFDALSLPCAPLTLLTGFNGAGKSTTLQTLLLLAQSLRAGGRTPEIPLNGILACLGSPGEILKEQSQTNNLKLGVENDQVKLLWQLQAENRSEGRSMRIQQTMIETAQDNLNFRQDSKMLDLLPESDSVPQVAQLLVNSLREIIFLSATRLGTAEVFPSPEEAKPIQANVGLQGEFAPWWFLQSDLESIDIKRCHPSNSSPIPRTQFNTWANELFPGAQFNVQAIPQTTLNRLELRIGNTEWRRPTNIGYGLTYAFPILVAGLLAKPGQILIIDSPEAHLHPQGQSYIGRFLAKVAAAGVQVMIETHSDHVLNGVRLALSDNFIAPEQVAVHFFSKHPDCPVISPQIDKEGNLSEWPEGFFDQAEKDMAHLVGWG